MKGKIIGLAALALVFSHYLAGQVVRCGTPDQDNLTIEDIIFAKAASSRAGKTTVGIKTIPIAVHVIYANASDDNNIDDAQIQDQINILNADYAGGSGGVDTEIRFCLAGVNRIQSAANASITYGANHQTMKALSQEDPNTYLNIWIVDAISTPTGGNILGYTTFPKGFQMNQQLDGVVIADDYFGSIGTASNNPPYTEGRTATHEIGHWLNLFHVFQNGCDDSWTCEFKGDCCCDTPPQDTAYYKCKTLKNSCHGDNPDERDPIRNYMGYSDDDCMEEFTNCQKGRMQLTLDSLRPSAFFSSGDCPPFKWAGGTAQSGLSEFNVSVFPNPSKETVTLRLNVIGKETPINVDIYDAQGKLVASLATSSVLAVGQHEYRFDTPAPGIYLARVASPWATKTIKLVSITK
jgi:hypothetical protein